MTPILLLGAGRMGSAIIAGWEAAGAFAPSELMVRDPHPSDEIVAQSLSLNPADEELSRARTVLLAVKPQLWRQAAAETAHLLDEDAVIVSIAAGVASADLAEAFGGRRVARVMPTTAVAIRRGVASVHAADPLARGRAHALFAPIAEVVDLADEDLMHAATAVSGSGPAYLYAFTEALEAAALKAGLPAEAAARLARSTVVGAAALLEKGGEPSELRRQVTSPGGTTQAALEVLIGKDALGELMAEAVAAAVKRSRELGA